MESGLGFHFHLVIMVLFCPQTSIKEGQLLKQTSSFQRWKKRYFKLRGRTLYYAKDSKVIQEFCSQALHAMVRSKASVVQAAFALDSHCSLTVLIMDFL